MAALLTLTDLHARYGDSHVLRGVSLEIPAGSHTAIVGGDRNLAGKTAPAQGLTLMRVDYD